MCDGVSEALAVAAIAGGALKAAGSISQGRQQQAIDNANANILDTTAGDARLRGATAAGQVRMRTSSQIGQEEAQVGASGVTSAGSPLDVISDKRWLSELDASTIDANAQREADASETKAANLRIAGAQAKSAGELGAVGDIIGGTSQALQFGSKAGWLTPTPTPASNSGTVITSDWADGLDATGGR
jgi:hypothetical protein